MKAILISFCLSGTVMFAYFGLEGNNGMRGTVFKVVPVSLPSHALQGYEGTTYVIKSGIGFQNIRQFKKYVDSLATTSEGRYVLDSLRMVRPGLLDSMVLINKVLGLQ
ncbi:hypothetical protein [Chitinophaga vietnamensis]|uniref:hypothetical protein n=1 Tax=Chitinophaga vietnamensis TaxID=2593957 RepID=UPI001178B38C|nr:hypothetical protein [Chitinophaga vietnamensis]